MHCPLPPKTEAETDTAPAAFSILRGNGAGAAGLVFASPHSGSHYPYDMGSSLDICDIRKVEDAAMDRLISSAPDHGITVLLANYGRAYVDLNRASHDLDPALISDCPPREPNAKTLAGYGVLHRLSGEQQPLYDCRLTLEQANHRLDTVYRPYHLALRELMEQARSAHGKAVLIDWHSMPERATLPNGPDIILGDRHGTSCDPQWTRAIRNLFEVQGLRVGLNRPYAGGYATQLWGRPEEGLHALQIEVSRRLYWNEQTHEPSQGWKLCQSVLKRVIANIAKQPTA